MYDAIYPQNLPPGGDAYLGYADGRWPDYLAVAAAHGNVPVYALTVFGTDGVGGGVDSEPGDATVEQAAQYLKDTIAAGKVDRPIGYTMESWAKSLVDATTAIGVDRTHWRLLTAHTGRGAHLCGPTTCGCPVQADGTQHGAYGTYDESLITDQFLGAASHPGVDEVTNTDLQNIVNALTPIIHDQVSLAVRELLVPTGEGYGRVVSAAMRAIQEQPANVPPYPSPEAASLKGETATITFN